MENGYPIGPGRRLERDNARRREFLVRQRAALDGPSTSATR